MALYFNGVNVPPSAHVYFNNKDCQKVFHNNQLVWQRVPDYLFKDGNTYPDWTGGWVSTPWYPFYGNPSGRPNMDNRNGKRIEVGSSLIVESTYAQYNGQGIKPSKKIDFTNINHIEVQFSLEFGNYEYSWVNITIGNQSQFVQFSNSGTVATSGFNCSGPSQGVQLNKRYTITMDTRNISGSYDLILSYCCGESGNGRVHFYYVKIS